MKLLAAVLLLSLLPGCATFEVEVPISHRFTETVKPIDALKFTANDLASVPRSPEFSELKFNGTTYAGLNQDGWLTFKDMEKALSFNTDVAQDSLALNETLLLERENLILLGTYEEERANYYAEKWAVNEEEIMRQEAYHRVETATYQATLILALLALIL